MINYTIIPQSRDGDGLTIDVNSQNQYELQDSYRYDITKQAKNELRMTRLEVASSVSDYTEDQADVFTDNNGIKNTVNTGGLTTMNYDTTLDVWRNWEKGEISVGTMPYDTQRFGSTGLTITNNSGSEIQLVSFGVFSQSSMSGTFYIDGVSQGSMSFGIGYVQKNVESYNITIPNGESKTIHVVDSTNIYGENSYSSQSSGGVTVAKYSSAGFADADNTGSRPRIYWKPVTPPTSTEELEINYSKVKPSSALLVLYEDNDTVSSNSNITYKFRNDTDYSEALTPNEIAENLNLSFTPTDVIVYADDTEIVSIYKYVLVVQE